MPRKNIICMQRSSGCNAQQHVLPLSRSCRSICSIAQDTTEQPQEYGARGATETDLQSQPYFKIDETVILLVSACTFLPPDNKSICYVLVRQLSLIGDLHAYGISRITFNSIFTKPYARFCHTEEDSAQRIQLFGCRR